MTHQPVATAATSINKRVVVATGGPTLEAEGTVASTDAIFAYLATKGARTATLADVGNLPEFITAVASADIVFNAIHGRGGEDGGLHYLLELINPEVPVTGPQGWVHALGADKVAFKAFAARHSVPVPPDFAEADPSWSEFVNKPRFGGGSHGLVVLDRNDVAGEATTDRVVEALIEGRTVTACVYPRLATTLPLLEVVPSAGSGIYTMADKRGRSDATYNTIEIGDADWTRHVWDMSQRLYNHLGRRGPIRFDWIIDSDDAAWLLEANTNPGWRPTGNMGRIVLAAGFTYAELIDSVLSEAQAPVGRDVAIGASGSTELAQR